MDPSAMDCPVCLTAFDNTLRRPRSLPCGHTFCTPCMDGLQEQGQLTCPTCRLTHALPEVGQFPVNYALEGMMSLRGAESLSPSLKPGKGTGEPEPRPTAGPSQEGWAGLSRPIRSLLQEQEAKVLAAIHTCQEVEAQLDLYRGTLVDWGERQQALEDRLHTLMEQSKGARVLVRQEESKVADKKDRMQQGGQRLQTLLQGLRTATTRPEACDAIEEAEHGTEEEGQQVEECRESFPDKHTVTTVEKVREVSSAAVEAAAAIQEAQQSASAVLDPGLPPAIDSSIMDRLEALLTPTLE